MNAFAAAHPCVAAIYLPSWAAAKAFKAYAWGEEDKVGIATCASEILKLFPKAVGHEDLLNATLAFQLQRRLRAPVYLVAGTLRVDGVPVRGHDLPPAGAGSLDGAATPWRGHLWIMIGPYVIDAAIFRLANSPDCPPLLARHVHSVFGQDKALYADHWRRSRRIGLDYHPHHVLSEEEMGHLLTAAYGLIKDNAR